MTPDEVAAQCRQQIALAGEDTVIVLILPGRWKNSNGKRLCPGGPVGTIVADDPRPGPPRVVVNFKAREVLDFIERNQEQPS